MNEKTISLKEDEQKQRKEYSIYEKQSSYGIPPWKIGDDFFPHQGEMLSTSCLWWNQLIMKK